MLTDQMMLIAGVWVTVFWSAFMALALAVAFVDTKKESK